MNYKITRMLVYRTVVLPHICWKIVFLRSVTNETILFHTFHLFYLFLWADIIVFVCSINTVYYMAPFATMILAVPAVLLEGAGVYNWFYTHQNISSAMIIILSSGVLAFCLNFSIFYVIHSTTAVTFNVAGNLKVSRSTLQFHHHVCNSSLLILTFLII